MIRPADSWRILLLYDCVYPESVGGVERRNAELARALAARGHDVTVAGPTASPGARDGGYRVADIAGGRPILRPGARRGLADTLRYAGRLGSLDLSPFDVVETANIPYAHLPVVARRARRARVPWVVTWHEFWGPHWRTFRRGHWTWPLLAAAERRMTRLGSLAIAPSVLTAGRVERHRGGPVPVVPGGVWLAQLERAMAAGTAAPEEVAALVTANRLIADKRTDLLLRAVALLAERLDRLAATRAAPRILLDVIGDGPERPALERLTGELGLSARVRFRGRLESAAAVWRTLAAARAAVQPSAREGFGLFALEALALGVPVAHVRSPDSAVGETVRHGVEGLACDPDPAALCEILASLLTDDALHARLAAAARARAASFDWSAIAASLEAAFAAARDAVSPPARR